MDELLQKMTAAVAKLTEEMAALSIEVERQNEIARAMESRIAEGNAQ